MAFPTALNSQITDSVSQANLVVLGNAPAVATGNLLVVTSQALANSAQNATQNQQNATVTAQSATIQGVGALYGGDTGSTGEASGGVFSASMVSIKKVPGGVPGLDLLNIPGLDVQVKGLGLYPALRR